jgi:hypothetical protein
MAYVALQHRLCQRPTSAKWTPQEWDGLPWALLKAGYRQPGFSGPEWSIVVNGTASCLRLTQTVHGIAYMIMPRLQVSDLRRAYGKVHHESSMNGSVWGDSSPRSSIACVTSTRPLMPDLADEVGLRSRVFSFLQTSNQS